MCRVSFWRDLFLGGDSLARAEAERTVRFSDVDPGVLYGTATLDQWVMGTARVSRRQALQVPAIKLADELICSPIGGMPLHLVGPDGKPLSEGWSLFSQPEAGVPRSVSMTRVVRDMLYDERCTCRITHLGWHGKPAEWIRLEADTVTVQQKMVTYPEGTAMVWPENRDIIRFESPKHGLLQAGGRAIRALWSLEMRAAELSGGMPPVDYFTSSDGVPLEDDEIDELLDSWATVRANRATGYVPPGLEYNSNTGFNAEQLQMMAQREFAITEVARLTGLDAERLSVSTTSRTYFNAESTRKDLLDFVLAPFIIAIQDRLSMDDVSPRGYKAVFDVTGFLTADDTSRATADKTLVDAQILSVEEARERRGLPARPTPDERPPAAAPATQETAA